MASLFVSYSHHDLATAREIHHAILAAGLQCWRDEKWLQPGQDFAEEITRAIRQSDAFVLLLSPASNASDYVCREVAIAHHFHKPIIPVRLAQGDLTVADGLLPYVVRLHYWSFGQGGAPELAARLAGEFGSSKGAAGASPPVVAQQPETPRSEPVSPPGPVRLVTNLEYLEFVKDSGYRRPRHWSQSNPHFPGGEGDAPVTWVSWDDAVAYCDWQGGRLPGASSDAPAGDAATSTADALEIGEWRDAGTERAKQVRDPHTSRLVAIADRESQLRNVGLRCDPVQPPLRPERVLVDGGPCQLGTDVARFSQLADIHRLPLAQRLPVLRRPVGKHNVHGFAISATCVTNNQFYEFTQATGSPWPDHWHARWLGRSGFPFPARLASQPVVNVSAEIAQTYCIWSRARLPSWLDWEYVASGATGQPYPWGADYDAARCNSVESGRGSLAAVDEYPLGDNPEGVRQLCGNVAEWVVGPDGQFEVRGGSYRLPCELWGLAYVFRQPECGFQSPDAGFRVVLD
jgi:formylglycine-generating enzyme required for sulfatase activity